MHVSYRKFYGSLNLRKYIQMDQEAVTEYTIRYKLGTLLSRRVAWGGLGVGTPLSPKIFSIF